MADSFVHQIPGSVSISIYIELDLTMFYTFPLPKGFLQSLITMTSLFQPFSAIFSHFSAFCTRFIRTFQAILDYFSPILAIFTNFLQKIFFFLESVSKRMSGSLYSFRWPLPAFFVHFQPFHSPFTLFFYRFQPYFSRFLGFFGTKPQMSIHIMHPVTCLHRLGYFYNSAITIFWPFSAIFSTMYVVFRAILADFCLFQLHVSNYEPNPSLLMLDPYES